MRVSSIFIQALSNIYDWYFYENIQRLLVIDPFHATRFFQSPVKTSENLWSSDIFRGIERDQWHEMG